MLDNETAREDHVFVALLDSTIHLQNLFLFHSIVRGIYLEFSSSAHTCTPKLSTLYYKWLSRTSLSPLELVLGSCGAVPRRRLLSSKELFFIFSFLKWVYWENRWRPTTFCTAQWRCSTLYVVVNNLAYSGQQLKSALSYNTASTDFHGPSNSAMEWKRLFVAPPPNRGSPKNMKDITTDTVMRQLSGLMCMGFL